MSEVLPTAGPRRFLRYSLRSLFVLMTFCCLAVYQSHVWLKRMQDEEDAIGELRLRGALVGLAKPSLYDQPEYVDTRPPWWFRKLVGKEHFVNATGVWTDHLLARLLVVNSGPTPRGNLGRDLAIAYDEQFTEQLLADLRQVNRKPHTPPPVDATDEFFRQVARLPGIRCLELTGPVVDEEGFSHLSGLRNLQRITLGKRLMGVVSPLEFSGVGLRHLRDCPAITQVDLALCNSLTAEGLRAIAELPHLATLAIPITAATPDGVGYLANCRTLEELTVNDYAHSWSTIPDPATESACERLGRIGQLKRVHFFDVAISGVAFATWKQSSVQEVTVEGVRLTPEGFRALEQLPHLVTATLESGSGSHPKGGNRPAPPKPGITLREFDRRLDDGLLGE